MFILLTNITGTQDVEGNEQIIEIGKKQFYPRNL